MSLFDVYEVTHVQSLFEQEVNNVYFYQERSVFVTTYPTVSQLVAERFVAQILPKVNAVQTADLKNVSIRVRNLFNAADSFELIISGTGSIASVNQTMPAFNAFGFTLAGDTAAVKPGAKRIAGVDEAFNQNGVFNGTAMQIGFFTALADTFKEPLTVGLIIQGDVFYPVLVKRVRSGTKGNYTYKLPTDLLSTVVSTIITTSFNLLITSQTSRKVGIGI